MILSITFNFCLKTRCYNFNSISVCVQLMKSEQTHVRFLSRLKTVRRKICLTTFKNHVLKHQL